MAPNLSEHQAKVRGPRSGQRSCTYCNACADRYTYPGADGHTCADRYACPGANGHTDSRRQSDCNAEADGDPGPYRTDNGYHTF